MGWFAGRRGGAKGGGTEGSGGGTARTPIEAEILPPEPEPLVGPPVGRTFDAEGHLERRSPSGPRPGEVHASARVEVRGCLPALLRVLLPVLGLGLLAATGLMLLGATGWSATDAASWLRAQGELGKLAVVATVAASTLLLVPTGILAVLPGYVWGTAWGTLLVVIGAALGGVGNMLVARRLFRARAAGWLEAYPLLAALRGSIAARGFRLALALRLSPVAPYAVLAYIAGLVGMPVRAFVAASLIGGIPWTAVYAGVGALLAESGAQVTTDAAPAGPGVTALRLLGLLLTVGVAVWIGRLARADLERLRAGAG